MDERFQILEAWQSTVLHMCCQTLRANCDLREANVPLVTFRSFRAEKQDALTAGIANVVQFSVLLRCT